MFTDAEYGIDSEFRRANAAPVTYSTQVYSDLF